MNTPTNTEQMLISYVTRIENLMWTAEEIKGDIKEIFQECKSAGFDLKIVRQVIKERAMDAEYLRQYQTVLESYRRALGVLADLPLGQAALRSVS